MKAHHISISIYVSYEGRYHKYMKAHQLDECVVVGTGNPRDIGKAREGPRYPNNVPKRNRRGVVAGGGLGIGVW